MRNLRGRLAIVVVLMAGLLPAGGDSLGSQLALAGDAFGFLAPT